MILEVETRHSIFKEYWHPLDKLLQVLGYILESVTNSESGAVKLVYTNRGRKKKLYLSYLPCDAYGKDLDVIYFIIFKEGSLPIYSEKVFHNLGSQKELSDGRITYTDESSFRIALEKKMTILKDAFTTGEVADYIKTDAWSESYNKPWYENSDL